MKKILSALGGAAVLVGITALTFVHAESAPMACPVGSTVVVVGDSITYLSADELDRQLRDAGYTPVINAKSGRTIGEGVEAVQGHGFRTDHHRCWVIALGTNDVGRDGPLRMRALESHLPLSSQVWWMRVAVPGGDVINDAVPSLTTLINWQPSTTDLYDGIHPTPEGTKVWASAVVDALTYRFTQP